MFPWERGPAYWKSLGQGGRRGGSLSGNESEVISMLSVTRGEVRGHAGNTSGSPLPGVSSASQCGSCETRNLSSQKFYLKVDFEKSPISFS